MNPNFAGKGQAYLVGLAMTDNPASLGTEMLQFSAQAKVSPLATRKQHDGNVFSSTDSVEAVLVEFEEETPAADPNAAQSFSVDAVIAGLKKAFKVEAPAPAAVAAAAVAATETPNTDAIVAAFTDQTLGQLQSEFTTLKTDLSTAPSHNHSARPDASGGTGDIVTDC